MHVYTEKIIRGAPGNISFFTALEAFYNMGFQLHEVDNIEELSIADDHVFVGSIGFIHQALEKLLIPVPDPNDYPESLQEFFGRRIYATTISRISADPSLWNVFVKPKGLLKKFTGRLVRSTADLIGTSNYDFDTPIWVSEAVHFISEWRAFVRYGEILDVRPYKGNWRKYFDPAVIEKAVDAFKNAPAAYAIDFGLTNDGRTLVVEVNEGYSVGSYGLFDVHYAKLLSARWCELTGQKDLCNF